MKRYLLATISGLMLLAASTAQATVHEFGALLDGIQAGSGSGGSGEALVLFDDVSMQFSWNLLFEGLNQPTVAAHVHTDTAGPAFPANGVVIAIDGTGAANIGINGNTLTEGIYAGNQDLGLLPALDAAQILNDLFNGDLYFNLHTAFAPGGEIRGQILPAHVQIIPLPAAVWLMLSAVGGLMLVSRRGT